MPFLNEKRQSVLTLLVCALVFAGAGYYILPIENFAYLRKLEELSIFMSGSWFFNECMMQPGGLIAWCSSFLTQFFFHPWLGATVMIALLLLLWYMVGRSTRLPLAWFVLAAVPSAMMLLVPVVPGYLVYILKSPGYAFNGILGLMVATGFLLLRRTAATVRWLRILVLIIAPCTYPLFGAYALLATLLCVIAELMTPGRSWVAAAIAVVLLAAVPQLYFYCLPNHAMAVNLYTALFPRILSPDPTPWFPYAVSIVALLALLLLAPLVGRRTAGIIPTAASCVVFGIALAAVFGWRYNDENFTTAMKMDMAISDGDYRAAVDAARSNRELPTRTVGLFTHVALSHLGQAGDSLFTFPFGDTEYASPRADVALRTVGSHPFNYHFGRFNDCYRWCMEDMVEYGPRVDYLKYMTKCALLNGEYDLARRYLAMLSRTTFHKEWAERYLAMADNPDLIDQDPEMAAIRPLNAFNNNVGGDGSMIETYIGSNIAALAGGPPALVNLSIQFNLVRKTIDGFWPRFILYARTHGHIPRHYQEAALLFSTLEHKVDWHQFNIDPDIVARFQKFMEMAQRNSRFSEEHNREAFRPLFGDTYWYYYFFTKGLKTT